MPRAPNPYFAGPYPTDPAWETAGSSLATALFGDPTARGKQQLQQSEIYKNNAEGGLNISKTHGQDTQNTGADSAVNDTKAMAAWFLSHQPGMAAPVTPPPPVLASGDPTAPATVMTPPDDYPTTLGNYLGHQMQAQGDKVKPAESLGALLAVAGRPNMTPDEQGRAALVATGHSPSADFAVTPGRADQIAATDATAKLAQALGAARIGAGATIGAANIHAGAEERGQDVSARTARRGQDIEHGDRLYNTNVTHGTGVPVLGTLLAALPPGRDNSDYRTPGHNAAVGGVPNSHHTMGSPTDPRALDYSPAAGLDSVNEASIRAAAAAKGIELGTVLRETYPGDPNRAHWHIDWNPQAGAKQAKTPVGLDGVIDHEINQQLGIRTGKNVDGFTVTDPTGNNITGSARAHTKARAIELFQQTGNAAASVQQAIKDVTAAGKAAGLTITPKVAPSRQSATGKPITATNAQGQKATWNGKAWVL